MSKGGGQMKVREGSKTTEEGKARYEVKVQFLIVCVDRFGMVREERRDKREKVRKISADS
jgi:hypothetical protein